MAVRSALVAAKSEPPRQHAPRAFVVAGGEPFQEALPLRAILLHRSAVHLQQLAVGLVGKIAALVVGDRAIEGLVRLGQSRHGLRAAACLRRQGIAVERHAHGADGIAQVAQRSHAGERVVIEVGKALLRLAELPEAANSDGKHGKQGQRQGGQQALSNVHGT